MNEFISEYQYHLGWAAYIASGVLFGIFWWRVTRPVAHRGWRDLLRGISLVMMFTPWYTSAAREHLAPAVMVAVMDLLLDGTPNGFTAFLVLMIATAVVLGVLIVRRLLAKNDDREDDDNRQGFSKTAHKPEEELEQLAP